MILQLEDVTGEHVSIVGNKAVNVAALLQAECNAPSGLVLTTRGVKRLVNDGGEEVYDALHDKILSTCGYPIAVRSSAVGEDGHEHSYAGIFRTHLNVRNRTDLENAVLSVIGSASEACAKQYSEDAGEIEMAVLIQSYVDAEHSGVLFTAHPVTGNSDEVVIEYFNGLGESVVGGLCTPNHGVYQKVDAKCVSFYKTTDGYAIISNQDGAGTRKRYMSESEITLVDDEVMGRLIATACKIEKIFQYEVDLEWAMKEGEVYILQARPITSMGKI